MANNNYSLRFDGTSKWVNFPTAAYSYASIAGLSVFTWEAWVKPTLDESSASHKTTFLWAERQGFNHSATPTTNESGQGTSHRFGVVCTTKQVRFALNRYGGTYNNYGVATGEPSFYSYEYDFGDDQWHHIAFAARVTDADASNQKYAIFIDGAQMIESTLNEQGSPSLKIGECYDATTQPIAAIYPPKYIRMGFSMTGAKTNTPAFWAGKIDCVRLWNIKREQNAISTTKGNYLASPTTENDLIEEWRLEPVGGGTSAATFTGIKSGQTITLYSGYNSASQVGSTYSGTTVTDGSMWNTDRPFLADAGPDSTAPTTPTGLTTTNISYDSFTMSWSASTDNVYVQGYELRVSYNNTFTSNVTGYAPLLLGNTTLTHTITGLTPSTNYFWEVRAIDAAGNTSAWAYIGSPNAVTTTAVPDTSAPSTPTASSATNVTPISFRMNWTAATDTGGSGLAGYRVDISTDENFGSTYYVTGWASRVVGNVLTYDTFDDAFTALASDTIYYYRVRAVDNAGNESSTSNVVTVQTAPAVDSTPPNPVTVIDATSVEASSFVANWNATTDNVGVTGYLLDVSLESSFTTMLTGYSSLDVGNVLAKKVSGLNQNTQYYYRLRAYDAAGNISSNSGSFEAVTTDYAKVGTNIPYPMTFLASGAAEIRQANQSTNYSTLTTYQVIGTSGSQRKVLLSFNWGSLTGTVTGATLRVYTTNSSAATFKIAATTSAWDPATVTWATAPSIGTPISVNPTSNNSGYQISVSSLLTSGATSLGLMIYQDSGSTDDWQFSTANDQTISLELIIDPQTAFEVESIDVNVSNYMRTNLFANPNMQGSLTNTITSHNSGSVASNTTHFYRGTKSVAVTPAVTGGLNYSGARVYSTALSGTTARFYAASIYVKGSVATTSNTHFATLRALYTDASTSALGGVGFRMTTDWQLIDIPSTTASTAGKTLSQIYLEVGENTGTVNVFYIDSALMHEVSAVSTSVGGYFDGDTRMGGSWATTADASYSTFDAASLSLVTNYVGDSDADSSAVALVQFPGGLIAVPSTSLTYDRSIKTASWLSIGNSLSNVINLIENPSFENGTTLWSQTTATITQTSTEAFVGSKSLAVAVTGSGQGVSYGSTSRRVKASASQVIQLRAALKVPTGMSVAITIDAYNVSDTFISSSTTNTTTGNNAWQERTISFTCPASTSHLRVKFLTSTSSTGTFYLDGVQLVIGSYNYPYTDGDSTGGRWTGVEHLSHSWKMLEYNVGYETIMTATDPDGVFGTNPTNVYVETGTEPSAALTTNGLNLTVSNTTIEVQALYLGDDNQSSTAVVEYKRGDLSSWNRATVVYDRTNKQVLATIAYLSPGTEYDVRVTFTDVVVYGTNPQTQQVFTNSTNQSASVKPVISFAGFVLQGPDDHDFWVSSHNSFSHPSRRVQVESLPRIDGAVEVQSLWGTRTIQLRGGVTGDTRAALGANVALLRKVFAQPKQRLIIDTLDDTNRYFTATCTSFAIQEIGGQNISHVLWDAEFIAADPFRYESGESGINEVTLGNDDTISINNEGDLMAEPIFTIITQGSDTVQVTLISNTTGERLIPESNASIKLNDVLVADTSKLSLVKNSYEMDYAGSFIRLAPGENVIRIILSPTTAEVVLSARYRQRYL